MKIINGMKAYTFEELLDKFYGPIGTPERDAFHAAVKAEVEAERKKLEAERAQARKRAAAMKQAALAARA